MPDRSVESAPADRADRTLVIKSGAGLDDPERCIQAFTVAATALTTGATVSMWLMGDAVHLAVPGEAARLELTDAPDLTALLASVLVDGTLTVCTQCAARRGLSAADLLDGVRVAGAASYVEEVLAPNAQALIY